MKSPGPVQPMIKARKPRGTSKCLTRAQFRAIAKALSDPRRYDILQHIAGQRAARASNFAIAPVSPPQLFRTISRNSKLPVSSPSAARASSLCHPSSARYGKLT